MGQSRFFGCKLTPKKKKEKNLKTFDTTKLGKKKEKKRNHFGGEPSLGVVVASAQAWDLAASSPGTPRADHKQQTRKGTR